MTSAIDSALSGLNAATTRLQVSANNIANQSSTQSITNGVSSPYSPQQVDQVSLSAGGVQALVSNSSQPAGDITNDLVNTNIASYDFKANLQTIKTQDEMQQSLLDMIG